MLKKIIIINSSIILLLGITLVVTLNRVSAVESKVGTITEKQFTELLMKNPKVIMDSVDAFRLEQEVVAKKKASEIVEKYADALYKDQNDPVFGNPDGKHVIVEFIDYNCGYCKKLSPTLKRFVELDPEAKVIVKEYPIFTNQPTSQFSAEMGTALSLYDAEKFGEYHHAILSQGRLTKDSILKVLSSLDVDEKALEPYLQKAKEHVAATRELGVNLSVRGTPTVFVGNERMERKYTAEDLVAMFN